MIWYEFVSYGTRLRYEFTDKPEMSFGTPCRLLPSSRHDLFEPPMPESEMCSKDVAEFWTCWEVIVSVRQLSVLFHQGGGILRPVQNRAGLHQFPDYLLPTLISLFDRFAQFSYHTRLVPMYSISNMVWLVTSVEDYANPMLYCSSSGPHR